MKLINFNFKKLQHEEYRPATMIHPLHFHLIYICIFNLIYNNFLTERTFRERAYLMKQVGIDHLV